jgi:predicted transcriptional regulator
VNAEIRIVRNVNIISACGIPMQKTNDKKEGVKMTTLKEKVNLDIEFYQRVLTHMVKEEKNIGSVPNLKKELNTMVTTFKKIQKMC